jgi:hypothetical protein
MRIACNGRFESQAGGAGFRYIPTRDVSVVLDEGRLWIILYIYRKKKGTV